MGKTRFQVYAALVFAIFSSIMLLILPASCNGNAGGSDGPTYSPGGGGDSSGQTQSGGDLSAIDILNYSNADDMETVVAILLGGGGGTDEAQTQAVTLSADAIGLPPDGTATLTITGNGVDYTATATADADGNVTFEIPAITTGSNITVSLSVKNSAGTLLYSGSQTEQLTGDNFTINVTLHRQYWTLPASLTVTASPSVIAYKASSAGSDSVLFNIAGLDDKPAGITLSYSWKDADGNEVGSGETLTRTVSELVGSGYTPPADGETLSKSYTVTVSFTDEAGDDCTALGSGTVTVNVPVQIPSFSVQMSTSATEKSYSLGGSGYMYNETRAFTFTATLPSGQSFPEGTTFEWVTSKGSKKTTTVPTVDFYASSFNVPSMRGKIVNSVTCTAKLPGSDDVTKTSRGINFIHN